jgi:hypothetical protein
MARHSQIIFSIPKPCNIPWNGMTPVDKDQRYCSSCDKVVTDFSEMSDDELMLYFRHNNGKICGRLHQTQMNRPMILLPEKTVNAKWWRTLILIPLTLIGKQTKAQYVEAANQFQSSDTNVLLQQNDSLRNDSLSGKKVVSVDSTKAISDTISVTLAKYDSTYKFVWKPEHRISYPDSLLPYFPDNIIVSGGCVAMEIITVWQQPEISLIPYQLEPNPIPLQFIDEEICTGPEFNPKSILTIFLDTIVPFRKKKQIIYSDAKNSEKVEMKDPLKQVSDKPREKPKPQQPALPSSDEFLAIMPSEKRKGRLS